MSDVVALAQPTFGEEEVDAVRAVLASGWVAGQGPRGAELEESFATLCDVEHAVAVSSCTAALHLALLALEVGTGDEVIVADYTYPATGHSVLYTGARPVFVDVRPDTWTIDVEAAEAAIGKRTAGIIAVDAFGQTADYAPLRELVSRHDLFLVEDAACSVGATYRGDPTGSLADLACFSLHARKGITSGEGGIVVTDDGDFADTARRLSCFGVASALKRQGAEGLPVPVFADLGYNYKLSDLQAAVALVQLERLPELLAARRRIADAYGELLADVAGLTRPVTAEDRDHTWQSYVVGIDARVDRGHVAARLREEGIQSNIGTFASHRQPVYGEVAPCPVSSQCFDQHLAIPMHANLTESEIQRVASTLATVMNEALR